MCNMRRSFCSNLHDSLSIYHIRFIYPHFSAACYHFLWTKGNAKCMNIKTERFTVYMQEIGSEMLNTNAHNENPFSACSYNLLIKDGSSKSECAVFVFLWNESCSQCVRAVLSQPYYHSSILFLLRSPASILWILLCSSAVLHRQICQLVLPTGCSVFLCPAVCSLVASLWMCFQGSHYSAFTGD